VARPKKEALSPLVGTLGTNARKSGNPDFVSSSFYVPKRTNTRFNRALLTLKDHDITLDRSDVLSVLMERFAEAVEAAEGDGDVDLETVLASAGETMVGDAAIAVVVRQQMQSVISEMQKEHQAQIDEVHTQMKALHQMKEKG